MPEIFKEVPEEQCQLIAFLTSTVNIYNISVMILQNESKLSMMVPEEANSFDMHTHAIRTAQLQLEALKKENNSLNNTLRVFREETKALMGEWAAMMGSVLHRQLKEKHNLEH